MKKIKNIIVPTDFSVTSRNAYHYAKRLAITLDATITVLHVNQYFMPIDEVAIGSISEDEVTKMSEEAMQAFVVDEDGIDHWKMIKHRVKTSVMKGDLVPILLDMSKQGETDLIVMGMTGMQDFIGKIIGSASLNVSNKAQCPVILVPRDAKWHKIEKVMYASNYNSTTPKMIGNITDFALALNAGVHFIHVEDATTDYKDAVAKIIWTELFSADDAPSLSFEIHTIGAGDTIEQLQKYAHDNQINLMTFMSKHRTFWQNLVHRSVTENMAISTEIPMMVMHLDD
jgi:nucleotide-binding universal stress UspA family protein